MRRLGGWLIVITMTLASAENKGDAVAGSVESMGEISYVVRWQPSAPGVSESTAIGISLAFTAEGARTTIVFPDRWALGLRDLHRRIIDISVDGSIHATSLDIPGLELGRVDEFARY